MPDDLTFSIPGLMEITRPYLNSQRVMLALAHKPVQDSLWAGIINVGPMTPNGVQPASALAKVEMAFGTRFPIEEPPALLLSSEDDQITITNADTWVFTVPEQPLDLPYGKYYWHLATTDSAGNRSVHYAGTIMISD